MNTQSTATLDEPKHIRDGQITVSLGKELFERVKRVADDQDRPASYIVRKAVENYLRNTGL